MSKKIEVKFDETRFSGNVYAMVGQNTLARIVEHPDGTFSVWSAPDAPPKFKADRGGISKDEIPTLAEAKAHAESYIHRRFK